MARMTSLIILATLACGCAGAELDKNRPVSKVLTLLKDMVGQLEKEAESDAKVKEEMDCWCESGLVTKTQAIADNKNLIGRLGSAIEEGAAHSARLGTETANLEKEVGENTAALEKATAMRKKQMAEFGDDEKSMIGSIAQMKDAVAAIAAKHDGSAEKASSHHRTGVQAFLQQSTSASEIKMLEVISSLKTQLHRHSELMTAAQREVVTAFVRSSERSPKMGRYSLLQQSSEFSPAHTSSSGGILGVLKGMAESFETNLEAAQREETTNQADYESLKKAKTEEIAAGTDLADKKSTEQGNTDQKHAQDKQNHEDTEKTLAADEDFLKNLKERCANVDQEFAERVRTRNQEITATSKALAYLNSDDAQDLYARTFSFVQVSSTNSARRVAGAKVLAAVAAKVHDPRLSALALRAKTCKDAFSEVTDSIQEMVDKLVAEKEDEIKHKDYCVDGIQKNEVDTQNKNQKSADHTYMIGELTSKIGTLKSEMTELKAAIDASWVSLKRAGEDRESQNTEFQKTVADQRATASLLAGALDMLKGFYDKAALVQREADDDTEEAEQPAGAAPPAGFKKREGASSGGVMGMIEQIIKDAEAMEAEAITAEAESQTAYESFVTETNASVVDMQKAITHKTETKALKESENAQQKVELSGVTGELEDLKMANEDLHDDCDYTIKNFDVKQAARGDEIKGLRESMSIFTGGMVS